MSRNLGINMTCDLFVPSPGTGRTGTLLAIDLGMLSYDDTKMVDILASVYRMRQDRGGMVQTREQYEYIYRVSTQLIRYECFDCIDI